MGSFFETSPPGAKPPVQMAAPADVQSGIPDNIAAEIVPLTSYGRRERSDIFTDDKWQEKIRSYDRHGPGIFGASLDLPAATSMLLDLCIRKRTPAGYEIVNDSPELAALLALWSGRSASQQTLFSRLIRTLGGPGEGYLNVRGMNRVHGVPNPERIWWDLAQTTNITDNRDGTTSIIKRRGAREGDRWHSIVDNKWVYHVLTSDPEFEGEAWSPSRRAIPHLEQFRQAMRNISRNLDSQLAMNGVLWAKEVGEQVTWPDRIRSWAARAIRDDDDVAGVMPFPMTTPEPPEWIDIGRGNHADQIQVAELFLKNFAQSSDLPTQMLLEGPGQGNHWSAYLEGDFYADMVMAPRWQRACAIITEVHLRPFMRAAPNMFAGMDPNQYEVWCRDDRIRRKTDNTDRLFEARRMGAIKAQPIADALGVPTDQVIDLPADVTDYEQWLISAGRELPAPEPEEGTVDEPDRDRLETDFNRRLETGPSRPTGETLEASADLVGELLGAGGPDPSYWNDLVPS